LDCIEELDPVLHRALERLPTRNQTHAACSLVDDRRERGVRKVLGAARPARIDQARTTEVTIRHLVTAQVDRVFAGQLGVDTLVELAVTRTAGVQGLVAAVVLRKFLLDDVGLDRATEVVRLTGEVRGKMIILVLLKGIVTQITPEHRGHPELVRQRKGFRDLDDFPRGILGAKVNGGSDGSGPHVVSVFDRPEENFLMLVRIGEQFVVVDLDQEGNLVSVLA
jgi:hypothetical protein